MAITMALVDHAAVNSFVAVESRVKEVVEEEGNTIVYSTFSWYAVITSVLQCPHSERDWDSPLEGIRRWPYPPLLLLIEADRPA